MKDKDFKMPAFGVGPMYVFICLCLTVAGLRLSHGGYLAAGFCSRGKIIFTAAGILFVLTGAALWFMAVVVEKINVKAREAKLATSGVYGLVRNPVYSAFIFIFTGILLFEANYFLFLLPIVFWIFLTVLMKNTEEKWLLREFSEEYAAYCREVNRVIPWFRKKK